MEQEAPVASVTLHQMTLTPDLLYGWKADDSEAFVDLVRRCFVVEMRALLDLGDQEDPSVPRVATIKCNRVGLGLWFTTDHPRLRYAYKCRSIDSAQIDVIGDAALFEEDLSGDWKRVVTSQVARKQLRRPHV